MAAGAGRSVDLEPTPMSEDEEDIGALGDSGSEEEMTNAEIIDVITKAWQAEKLSPDLLQPKEGEIVAMREELERMERNIRKLSPTDLTLSIYRMEVKRLRFIITAYLRTRLLKIQEYAWFYANQLQYAHSSAPFMMRNEILFLKEYCDNLDGFLHDVALKHMPVKLQTFDEQMRPMLRKGPNLNRFVFVRSNENFELRFKDANNESDIVNFEVGSQHFMPYKPLKPFVQSCHMTLL